jgi:hypothetical protein
MLCSTVVHALSCILTPYFLANLYKQLIFVSTYISSFKIWIYSSNSE